MKNKILATLFLTFFLFSCFGWESTTIENVTWLTDIENDFYKISIPEKWTKLESNDPSLPKPKTWEVTLAAISWELAYWFSNNLVVLTQNLAKETTSNDFSILNNVWATKEYSEYTKLDSKSIEFSDWDSTTLYVFEAKYNTNTPKIKFLQAWKVCNYKKAHLLTIALSTDNKDTSSFEDVIKSFKCK